MFAQQLTFLCVLFYLFNPDCGGGSAVLFISLLFYFHQYLKPCFIYFSVNTSQGTAMPLHTLKTTALIQYNVLQQQILQA